MVTSRVTASKQLRVAIKLGQYLYLKSKVASAKQPSESCFLCVLGCVVGCVCVWGGGCARVDSYPHLLAFKVRVLTLVFLRGGMQPPKQFLSRCSKSRSQGIKLLRVPLVHPFPSFQRKKNRTYHLPRG